MKTATKVTLISGALLAAIAPVNQSALADPTLIQIHGEWITGAGAYYTGVTGTHQFGGPPTIMPGVFLPQFTITATSGPSNRPGWEYELVLDFSAFALFTPGTWETHLFIKPEDTPNPITGYQVKNALGQVLATVDLGSTAGSIHISNNIADIMDGTAPDLLIIQWNQAVPAPGALALLGLAGMVGGRRRRA